MVIITSTDNKRIKEVRKLKTKKGRKKNHAFLVEGEHLVEEALNHGAIIIEVLMIEGFETHLDLNDLNLTLVKDSVMKNISSLVTPPGIVAVVKMFNTELSSNRILALDGVQDPGNLGTLIRTADAFNFKHILIGHDTVDPYSDKVLRSAQGSHFHVNIESCDLVEYMETFEGTILTTSLEGVAHNVRHYDSLMIVLGNEGQGVSADVLAESDVQVKIDMPGSAESLNVSVAGGILMHQYQA